jgi:hypothetical protein
MANKQQTAVDWLAEQMLWNEFHNPYLEQAKEMEKEQIEEAFANGVDDEYEYHVNNQPRKNTEDYYKETYE